MNPLVLALVERVIGRSDAAHPADAVLRQELKAQRNFGRVEAAEVSHLVFSFYRWRGWLDTSQGLEAQVLHARELAHTFARFPERIAEQELLERAVPSWIKAEMEVTPELARAFQTEPELWLRARPGQGAHLARRLGHCRAFGPGLLSDALKYQGREDLFRTSEFHAGAFELQDISSQAVGWLCAPQPGQVWWDACAGEGGKLLHLSDLMQNRGLIWGTDRSEWRLRKLKLRAARAKVFNYRLALWDGGKKLPTRTRFDGVLLDAPCSGTGTWQRNPHARWTLTAEDIRELAGVQFDLLVHASGAVKPGGRLVYSVCSLAMSETSNIADEFEREAAGFERLPLVNPLVANSPAVDRLWLLPQDVGGNGMFIAGWLKKD